jgi:hypothetical protein
MKEDHRLAPPYCAVTSSDYAHERCSLADVLLRRLLLFLFLLLMMRSKIFLLVSTFVAKKESVDSEVANVRFNMYRVCDMSRKTFSRAVLNRV